MTSFNLCLRANILESIALDKEQAARQALTAAAMLELAVHDTHRRLRQAHIVAIRDPYAEAQVSMEEGILRDTMERLFEAKRLMADAVLEYEVAQSQCDDAWLEFHDSQ